MFLEDPYEKKYDVTDVLPALEFYYKLMDKVDITIYQEPKLPWKRKDIDLTIHMLQFVDLKYKIWISHPTLQIGIEGIQGWKDLAEENLRYNFGRAFPLLDHFYASGCLIISRASILQISNYINSLNNSADKIAELIKQKYLIKNADSYPKKVVDFVMPFVENNIEYYKELQETEKEIDISEQTKKYIQEYVHSLLVKNLDESELLSPLLEFKYELFTKRLQELVLIPSSFDIKKKDKERAYHIFVLAVLTGRIRGYVIKSNKESGRGRYDIVLLPLVNSMTAVLIEIKKIEENEDVAKELDIAMNQINERDYLFEFRQHAIENVLKISLVFAGLKPHLKYELVKNAN